MDINSSYIIALDAHGSDHGVSVAVEGALLAIDKLGCKVVLVGDKTEIETFLKPDEDDTSKKIWPKGLSHFQADEKIEMHEEPVKSLRKNLTLLLVFLPE